MIRSERQQERYKPGEMCGDKCRENSRDDNNYYGLADRLVGLPSLAREMNSLRTVNCQTACVRSRYLPRHKQQPKPENLVPTSPGAKRAGS